jgi:hypothetical protein
MSYTLQLPRLQKLLIYTHLECFKIMDSEGSTSNNEGQTNKGAGTGIEGKGEKEIKV